MKFLRLLVSGPQGVLSIAGSQGVVLGLMCNSKSQCQNFNSISGFSANFNKQIEKDCSVSTLLHILQIEYKVMQTSIF